MWKLLIWHTWLMHLTAVGPVRGPLWLAQQPPPIQENLELSEAPSGFEAIDQLDGSIGYQGPSERYQQLARAQVQLLGVRHGQAQSNADSEALGEPLLYGQSDSPLTDKGREQAQNCLQKVVEQLGGSDWLSRAIDDPRLLPVVVSSDLSRAQETAEIFQEGLAREAESLKGEAGREVVEQHLQLHSDARLRETNFGEFETQPLSRLQSAYPGFVSHWRPAQGPATDYLHRFPGGGESRADVMRRMDEFLQNCCLRFPGKTVIVISHGETLLSTRALLGKAPVLDGKVIAETGVIPNAMPFWLVHEEQPQALPATLGPRPYDLE